MASHFSHRHSEFLQGTPVGLLCEGAESQELVWSLIDVAGD